MTPYHPTTPLLSTRHGWFPLYPFPNGSDSCSLHWARFQFPHAEVFLHSLLQSVSQGCLGRAMLPATALLPGGSPCWPLVALTSTLGTGRKEQSRRNPIMN